MTKKLIILIIAALVILFAGCNTARNSSFDELDVVAKIDGEEIRFIDKDIYHSFKIAELSSFSEPVVYIDCSDVPDVITYEDFIDLKACVEIELTKLYVEYEALSPLEKESYYKRELMRMHIYFAKLTKKEFSNFFENMDNTFEIFNDDILFGVKPENEELGTSNDTIDAIYEVAENNNISYEECLEKYYKPYWISTQLFYAYFNEGYDDSFDAAEFNSIISFDESMMASIETAELSEHLKDKLEDITSAYDAAIASYRQYDEELDNMWIELEAVLQ